MAIGPTQVSLSTFTLIFDVYVNVILLLNRYNPLRYTSRQQIYP
jgi:hypothetical protein